MKRVLSVFIIILLIICNLSSAVIASGEAISNSGNNEIISFDVGWSNTAAVKEDGSLWIWGDNHFGQISFHKYNYSSGEFLEYHRPQMVMKGVRSVSLGDQYCAVIKEDGSLWSWGKNGHGCVGVGSTDPVYEPQKIMDNVSQVHCGSYITAAIKEDGSLWMWGNNSDGSICDDSLIDILLPHKIMDDVKQVSFESSTIAAIKTDNTLWMWGDNSRRAIDWEIKEDCVTTPVKIMDDIKDVGCGSTTTGAVKKDGSLWMWGWELYGETGWGGKDEEGCVLRNVKDIIMGYTQVLALKEDGSLWVWGNNGEGQLGIGETCRSHNTPMKLMSGVKSAAAGYQSSAAQLNDGSLWVWGYNGYGQVGNGTSYSDGNRTIYYPELIIAGTGDYDVYTTPGEPGEYKYLIGQDTWFFPNYEGKILVKDADRVFSNKVLAVAYVLRTLGKSGECYGMSLAAATLQSGRVITPMDFGRNTIAEIQKDDYSERLGMTAGELVQMAQIFQSKQSRQIECKKNRNDLEGLYKACKRYLAGTGEPVLIDLEGHTILARGITLDTDDYCLINVYENQDDGIQFYAKDNVRYIKLTKKDGVLTDWDNVAFLNNDGPYGEMTLASEKGGSLSYEVSAVREFEEHLSRGFISNDDSYVEQGLIYSYNEKASSDHSALEKAINKACNGYDRFIKISMSNGETDNSIDVGDLYWITQNSQTLEIEELPAGETICIAYGSNIYHITADKETKTIITFNEKSHTIDVTVEAEDVEETIDVVRLNGSDKADGYETKTVIKAEDMCTFIDEGQNISVEGAVNTRVSTYTGQYNNDEFERSQVDEYSSQTPDKEKQNIVIDSSNRIVVAGIVLGDVDGNGKIDANDLTTLARHLAKISQITDELLLQNSDSNRDGKVTAEDLTYLAKYVAKIIPSL